MAIGLLQAHWKPQAIADKNHCHVTIDLKWKRNLQKHGIPNPLHALCHGPSRRIYTAAKNSALKSMQRNLWTYQDELATFLAEEWDISVHRATVGRLLQEARLSRKRRQRIGPQSQSLGTAWQTFMQDVIAEQLVFIDESLFEAQTCWRCMAYGPIGQAVRWEDDIRRGDTWSVLLAYTVEGYLPCIGIKKGFYNEKAFRNWLVNELLPHCNPFPGHRSIIIMDNLNVHISRVFKQIIEERGMLLKYLPPYSSDYNPIELTFSMLKA